MAASGRGRRLDHVIGIFQQTGDPFSSGDEFRRADAAILVCVNERERFRIELKLGGGAGEGNPEFLVKLIEIGEVCSGFEFDLIEPARAEEFPRVC